MCVCTYIGHPCSASPDRGLAVPAWCHQGQLGNLSRAQGLCFNLNTDLHNSSGIKPHCHNICLCVYLPLSAAGRCGVLGVCRPQIPFASWFSAFLVQKRWRGLMFRRVWEGQAPLEGKKAECGVKRRGWAEAELLSLVS